MKNIPILSRSSADVNSLNIKCNTKHSPGVLPFDLLNETDLLRSMLTQIGDELLILAPDGRIVYANEAAEKNLGVSKKTLLSKKITEFFLHKISPAQWQKDYFCSLKESRTPQKLIIERTGR